MKDNTKKIKNLLIVLLFSVCIFMFLLMGLCIILRQHRASAETTFVSKPTISEDYVIGETIILDNTMLAYDGKEYDANAFLILPNGSVVDTDSYTFTEGGAYAVQYKAKADNGTIIYKEICFSVSKSLFSYGEKTSVSKGEYTNRNDTHYEGLSVVLASGESLTYNKVIDLNELSIMDNMFDLFVIPSKEGELDISSLTFTFTDIYDDSNVVRVVHRQNGDTVVSSYLQAQAPGQTLVGLRRQEKLCGQCLVINGKYYHVDRGGQYGAWLNFSYSGQGKHSNGALRAPGEQIISLSWDYANRAVYGRTQHSLSGGGLIADLDESYMVTGWNGFTTGQVRLSISASGYTGSSAQLFFTNFMNEDFSILSFKDNEKPILTINKGVFENSELPKAKVGGEYKLFEASAFDVQDGVCDVEMRAYYGYYTNMCVEIPIEDRCIKTPYLGTYTIEYSSSDKSGLKTTKYIDITAVNENEIKPVLSIDTVSGEYVSGVEIEIAECRVDNATIDGVMTIIAMHESSGKTYEVKNGKFQPFDAGEYKISYRYKNYVFEVEENIIITVSAGVAPVFLNEAKLPRYMIKGMSYTLPVLMGYEIASGMAQEAQSEIFIIEDDSDAVALNGNVYKVAAENLLKVIYKIGITELVYDIPVVNVIETNIVNGSERKSLISGAYFYEKEGTFIRSVNTGKNISYTMTDTVGKLDYINSLLATDLELAFRAFGGGLTGLNVILSETNGDDVIVLSFKDKTCSINGETEFEIPCSFSESGERFLISYNNSEKKLVFGGKIEKKVLYTFNGDSFDGFISDKVDLSVEILGNGGEATFAIEQINNQTFPTTTDNVAPQLSHNDISGSYSYGQRIVLQSSFVGDVFSSDIDLKMYVKGPNNQYVETDDNIILDGSADPSRNYTITLKEYGAYEVCFEWSDNFTWNARGKSSSYTYFLYVVDEEKPQIVLGEKTTNGKVGQEISVASATVSDNISATEKIELHVCVKNSCGVISYVKNGVFKADKAGEYTVLYIAYDASGNMTMEKYVVKIQEG